MKERFMFSQLSAGQSHPDWRVTRGLQFDFSPFPDDQRCRITRMIAGQSMPFDSYCGHRACTGRIVSEHGLIDLVQKIADRIVMRFYRQVRQNLNDPPGCGTATRHTTDAVCNCQQKLVVVPAEHPDGIFVFVSGHRGSLGKDHGFAGRTGKLDRSIQIHSRKAERRSGGCA